MAKKVDAMQALVVSREWLLDRAEQLTEDADGHAVVAERQREEADEALAMAERYGKAIDALNGVDFDQDVAEDVDVAAAEEDAVTPETDPED